MGSVLGLLIGALFIIAATVIAAQVIGKRTLLAVSGGSISEIRRACEACFPTSEWQPVAGPGLVNMRPSLRRPGLAVVSVAVEEGTTGGYLVSVWRSSGAAWMELDDSLTLRRVQKRVLSAVQALPAARASRPALQ